MKIPLLRFDVNCSILFTELPLLERFDAARVAGFDGIELWWPFDSAVPPDESVDALVRSIESAGVQLAALNFFGGNGENGERGVLSVPGRSKEFQDNIDVVVAIGERLSCTKFNALYGNRVEPHSAGRQDELAYENLYLAAKAVAKINGAVLLEPLSGVSRYPLRTAAAALAVIDRLRNEFELANVMLLADLYHLGVLGEDVNRLITHELSSIGHIQVADAPGRHQPGTGSSPLDVQFAAIVDGAYAGWVGLEYVPTGSTIESFEWLPEDCRGTRR